MDLFIQVDTGTDYQNRFILNPLFVLLMESMIINIRVIAEMFGLRR